MLSQQSSLALPLRSTAHLSGTEGASSKRLVLVSLGRIAKPPHSRGWLPPATFELQPQTAAVRPVSGSAAQSLSLLGVTCYVCHSRIVESKNEICDISRCWCTPACPGCVVWVAGRPRLAENCSDRHFSICGINMSLIVGCVDSSAPTNANRIAVRRSHFM